MTTQGFRCAVTDCPMLRQDGIQRECCPEPEVLCEYVRCSIDPEDMPSFEEWVAQGGMSGTYPDPSDRPHYLDEIRDASRS